MMQKIIQLNLFIVCFYVTEVLTITLARQELKLTMYDYQVSWSRAQATCASNGGVLYKEDSPERSIVLERFRASWPYKHLWIGLHYPSTESNDEFGWLDCYGQNLDLYNNWDPSHPQSPNRCGFTDRGTALWESKPCEQGLRFVCQNEGEQCTFTNGTGIPEPSGEIQALTVIVADSQGCQQLCLIQIYNYKNCWAVNYEDRACTLYYTDDPFLFETHTLTTSLTSFHVKLCYYNGSIVTTEDSSINAIDSTIPDTPCTVFESQSTPTTLAPTTASTNGITTSPVTNNTLTTASSTQTTPNTTVTTDAITSVTNITLTTTIAHPTNIFTSTMRTNSSTTSTIRSTTSTPLPQPTSSPVQTATSSQTTRNVQTLNTMTTTTNALSTSGIIQSTVSETISSNTTAGITSTTTLNSTMLSTSPQTTTPTSLAILTTSKPTLSTTNTTVTTSTNSTTATRTTAPKANASALKTNTSISTTFSQESSTLASDGTSITSSTPTTGNISTTTIAISSSTSTNDTLITNTTLSTASSTTAQSGTSITEPTTPLKFSIITTTIPNSSNVASSSATNSNSTCLCSCSVVTNALSTLNLTQKLDLIRLRLRVDYNALSSRIRKKSCAKDNRVVSQSVGYAAVVFACAEISLIIMGDIMTIYKYFRVKFSVLNTKNRANSLA